MVCLVNLPNGTTFGIACDPKAIGQKCLEKVCENLEIICETEYFGLVEHKPSHGTRSVVSTASTNYNWINLRNPLHSANGQANLQLGLRVKFWVPPHLILQDNVRNIFYMQARVDLLEGRLKPSNWANAAQLIALMAHADKLKLDATTLIARPSSSLTVKQQDGGEDAAKQETTGDVAGSGVNCKKRRLTRQRSSTSIEVSISVVATPIDQDGNDSMVMVSPYEQYMIRPDGDDLMREDFYREVGKEHGKLVTLKMSPTSAKYWLLETVSKLEGFGEEVFSGRTTNDPVTRCDVSVGPHGIIVSRPDNKTCIPFSAASSATPSRSTFSLVYVTDNGSVEELKMKLPRQRLSASLYRAITEKHAFYSCETVCSDVTKQFIRDLKGTIASMFNVDTKLGKLYVFDIQRTCREVHDHARRILHARGIDVRTNTELLADDLTNDFENLLRSASDEDANAAAMKSHVDKELTSRIAEAFTCRVCMDNLIDTAFTPCGHVACCDDCAIKCKGICPLCRTAIVTINKVFLPTTSNNITPKANKSTAIMS